MKLFFTIILFLRTIAPVHLESMKEFEKIERLQEPAKIRIVWLLITARSFFPEYEIVVAETYRDHDRQNMLYKTGKSWVKNSMHTKGLAADIYFTNGVRVLEYNEAPYDALGELGMVLGLTWGGNWKVKDFGHFEYNEE